MVASKIAVMFAPLAVALALAVPAAAQAPGTQHLRGEITKVDGSMIAVKERSGATLDVTLPDNVRVSSIAAAKLEDIRAGSYVGTAAVPQRDGTLVAQEVLIFPEVMRGTGEGHAPWDLTGDSTMTNATVGTVTAAPSGQTMTLTYKDGEKKVTVPASAPIVTTGPGDKSMVKPGAKVFVVVQKDADGKLKAARIAVGKDGLMPPM
jgi:hypothetical protein